MLNIRVFAYWILPLFGLILTACDSAENKLPASLTQKLETELQAQHKALNFPGAVTGLWVENQGHWVSSVGVADKKTNEKIEFDDHFRIGSITKSFVTTALLILVDQHKLSLDDVIEKYVPGVPNGEKITVRQLGNMTSGLPNYSENADFDPMILAEPEKNWTAADLLALAFKQQNAFEPGTSWEYSNTNTVLLGMVIEKITGKPLPDVLEELIIKPLGLKSTLYPLDAQMPTPYAKGYTLQSVNGAEEDATFRNPSWTNAAGQMISTIHDMKIWVEALATGKLLSKETFEQRLQWVNAGKNNLQYGFGLFKINDWIGHNGELPGYNSFAAYNPILKAAFVCLVNSDSALSEGSDEKHPADGITQALLQIVTADIQSAG